MRDELIRSLGKALFFYALCTVILTGILAYVLVQGFFKANPYHAMIGSSIAMFCSALMGFVCRHRVLKSAIQKLQQMSLHYEMGDQRLQQARLETLGQLTAGIFHEINNPITSIDGYAYQIEEEIRSPSTGNLVQTVQRANERIRYNVARVREMIRTLKNFSRSSSSHAKPDNVLLKQLIEDSVLLVKPLIKAKGIELNCRMPNEESEVEGHFVQLSQVLVNYLTNSIDAVARGNLKARKIVIGFEDFGAQIELYVEDSGLGVPDPIKERIFEAFFTTKDVGQGTGLGLSICHEIARNHHARIGFKNLKDGLGRVTGSRFYLNLPKVQLKAQNEIKAAA